MILVICPPGHVAETIARAASDLGEDVRMAGASSPDLFDQALGCRAVVYAADGRLLGARDTGDPERMRAVIGASHAPGVRHVVVVVPQGDGWSEEIRVLQKDGVPYTVLRAAALVEELADATNLHVARSVWLPRGSRVELGSCAALAQAIRDALTRDDLCGSTLDVPVESMEIAEAMQRAAELTGVNVRVHVASPGVSVAMRRLSLWMGLAPPELEAICDRLGRRGAAAAPARAVPP